MKPSQRVADVIFIFEDCARLHERARTSGFKSLSREDIWPQLPHPSGSGHQLCSAAAAEKIEELAVEAGRAHKIQRRIKSQALSKALGELLVKRFQQERRPIVQKEVDRVLSQAARAAKRHCVDRTHFVPCHLMWEQEPDQIAFGPITFRNHTNFRSHIVKQARAFRLSAPSAKMRGFYRQLLSGTLQYFKSFKWVAEVSVQNCDPETSQEIAEAAVTSALNCLHLMLGAGYTAKMRVRGPRIDRDRRGRLSIANGNLHPSVSSGGPGEIGFGKGWSSVLEKEEHKQCAGLMGIALEAALDPDLDRPLSRRFLDAALWFGEAVRETSPAARVVKFVTAIERMVMTEEQDDIAKLVSERVAVLCHDASDAENRELWRREAQKVYVLRSKLVHGVISPDSEMVLEGVRLGAKVARATIISALFAYGETGLRDDKVNSKRLAKYYKRIVAHADGVTAQ